MPIIGQSLLTSPAFFLNYTYVICIYNTPFFSFTYSQTEYARNRMPTLKNTISRHDRARNADVARFNPTYRLQSSVNNFELPLFHASVIFSPE